MFLLFSLFLSSVWATLVHAQWSVLQPKNQVIFGGSNLNYTKTATPSGTAAFANFTAAAEYDPTVLNPPPIPSPPLPTVVPVQLTSSGGLPNLSARINGAFFGFSVEMSVANQVCEWSFPLVFRCLDRRAAFYLSGEEQVSWFPRSTPTPH